MTAINKIRKEYRVTKISNFNCCRLYENHFYLTTIKENDKTSKNFLLVPI